MKKLILLILCCLVCCASGFCTTQAEFSVSEDTKVVFSEGNVQYHPKKDMWRFVPNQYDVVGKANKDVSSSYNGWVDLFGWGTGNNPCLVSGNYKDYTEFVDWGVNFESNDSQWRTLTEKEWMYLLCVRENASKLLGIGTVAGIGGIFILPDNANLSDNEIDFISLAEQGAVQKWACYSLDNELALNNYTTKQWEVLETVGVVFLPFVGKRDAQTVEQTGDSGYYWSSEIEPTSPFRSYGLLMSNMSINTKQPIFKQVGCAVRLVYNIK